VVKGSLRAAASISTPPPPRSFYDAV